MVVPYMATLLSVGGADAAIAAPVLERLMARGVEGAVNAVPVDGGTSASGTLMLFAAPAMLGTLRNLLDGPSAKLVQHSAAIDLTAFSGRELEARIAQQLER